MMKPKIIAIAGPNGAGKSTLAPFLLRDAFGVMDYVNADTIAEGLSAFEPQGAAIEAGRVMLRRMRNLIEQRKTFAFESTLSGRTPARWIDLAKREGFEFHLLFLRLESEELAIERVAERVRRGGHDVPEDVIRRRYRLGIRNFFEMYQPQADEWMMYDTSLSESDLIAAGRGNNVSTVYKRDKWQKICEELK
ncbi:MAG TPA: AAA family ATPase [Blastocatellia bacterium]|jgi:predicted ABC-type ATPase